METFADIHCHLIPNIDDGAKSWDESIAMAKIAVADGITHIVATPHQLGAYNHNTGAVVRSRVEQLQSVLKREQIPLNVLAGGDVRIDTSMLTKLRQGDALTLADQGKHVLLELPHELYFPLDNLLGQLGRAKITGILSHPERNQGIIKNPDVLEPLVRAGCLMQVTAGSLMGTFGPSCRQLAEWMLQRNLVHFVATDAHGPHARRPLMRRAFERVAQLVNGQRAIQLCCQNPSRVIAGQAVEIGEPIVNARRLSDWLPWRKSA